MADAQGRVSNAYLSNASLHLRPQSYARALSRNASRGLLITAGAALAPLGRSRSGGIEASRSARGIDARRYRVFDANGVVLAHFYACLTARLLSRTPD
jgi:hypothetical protein